MLDRKLVEMYALDSARVIKPYLTGRELLDEFEITRWVIDFGRATILEASQFKSAFSHCKVHVLPDVEAAVDRERKAESDMLKAREEHLNRWWQLWNRRDEMTETLAKLRRYIGCSRVTRRPIMCFISSEVCPSDLVQVFAFDDDYSFGVLQSELHFQLFRTSSRLKVESDTRYSVRDVFEKFPWPQAPSEKDVKAIADAGREIRRLRESELVPGGGGLRGLYRTLDLPGKNPLRDAHLELDLAVMNAYGFSKKDDRLGQIMELNRQLAEHIASGREVTSPGLPSQFRGSRDFVTDDRLA